MNIKRELQIMFGYKNRESFYKILKKYRVDFVKLYNVLEADTPLIIKRDYIYSIVREVIADHWWTNYVDDYFERGGQIK